MLKLECVRVIPWENDKVLKNENMKNEINKICSSPNEYLFLSLRNSLLGLQVLQVLFHFL